MARHELAQNLGDENVTRRLRAGIVALFLGLGWALVLERTNADWPLRLTLFLPFFVSVNAFFQGMLKNCGFSAYRGCRQTLYGQERIADRAELEKVKARGRVQLFVSFFVALALTLCFVVLP